MSPQDLDENAAQDNLFATHVAASSDTIIDFEAHTPSRPTFTTHADLANIHIHTTDIPYLHGAVAALGSDLHQQALKLQADRFARASTAANDTYLQTVDYAPNATVPLVVYKHTSADDTNASFVTQQVVGAARLELSGATVIESAIRFRPGSPTERQFASGTAAEIGGLAINPQLDSVELLDTIDTITALIVAVARHLGLETLWIFPRRALMSLLLMEIPGVLPPFHFTLCHDAIGWREESAQLQGLRAMGVKGFFIRPSDPPMLYVASTADFAQDYAARVALQRRRYQARYELANGQFSEAMTKAMRGVHADYQTLKKAQQNAAAAPPTSSAPASVTAQTSASRTGASGYLPFDAEPDFKAEYLRLVVEAGGPAASEYKRMSYDLLDLASGHRVLDVGCGAGVDLAALAERVSPTGRVVGLDHDNDLVQAARTTVERSGQTIISVLYGDAEHMTIPSNEFDRARIDRALQHMLNPQRALREIWRVLRPGGKLTITEPDWKSMVLYPASANGGNDDSALQAVLERYQRKLPHALIGRQLLGLLASMTQQVSVPTMREPHVYGSDPSAARNANFDAVPAWSAVRVQSVAFNLTGWRETDAVLQLTTSAKVLAEEMPTLAPKLQAWLQAINEATRTATFYAMIPLYFATATKAPVYSLTSSR